MNLQVLPAGWDEEYRIPIRVITSRAYHALFMQNMLVPPSKSELYQFEANTFPRPFVIFNAGGRGLKGGRRGGEVQLCLYL